MKNLDHDVFISYSSKNKNIADAIVADLEQNNVKCWYAPRDILSGEDWAGAINNAISSTKIFVLVFTDESNRSHQVTNEVTLAVNGGKIIIPFRLSGSDMNDTLQYYLSSVHWLDAVSQPLSHNIETLRKQIIALLDIDETAGSMAAAAGIPSAGAAAGSRGAQSDLRLPRWLSASVLLRCQEAERKVKMLNLRQIRWNRLLRSLRQKK